MVLREKHTQCIGHTLSLIKWLLLWLWRLLLSVAATQRSENMRGPEVLHGTNLVCHLYTLSVFPGPDSVRGTTNSERNKLTILKTLTVSWEEASVSQSRWHQPQQTSCLQPHETPNRKKSSQATPKILTCRNCEILRIYCYFKPLSFGIICCIATDDYSMWCGQWV